MFHKICMVLGEFWYLARQFSGHMGAIFSVEPLAC